MQKQNQKGFIIPLILAIVVIVILGTGGYLVYKSYSVPKQTADKEQNTTPKTETPVVNKTADQTVTQQISDTIIINSISKIVNVNLTKNSQGKYSGTYTNVRGGFDVAFIAKGDLNNDGLEDAVVAGTHCAASCGKFFGIVINKGENLTDTFSVVPEDFVMSGATQYGVENIVINNGIISITTAYYPDDTLTLKYKLVGKNLVKI